MEVAPNFPDECRYVLEMLGRVYRADAEAREHEFTPQQRLELHRQRSAPVMEELHAWLERQFAERRYSNEFASHNWQVWIRLMNRSPTAAPFSVR